MAMSDTAKNAALNAIFNNGTTMYVKLHIGDPGAAGTANPATVTTRKALGQAAAASGAWTNNADLDWDAYSASEDVTHVSVWDHATAGTFWWSGTVTANAITSGNNFSIPAGDLDATLS